MEKQEIIESLKNQLPHNEWLKFHETLKVSKTKLARIFSGTDQMNPNQVDTISEITGIHPNDIVNAFILKISITCAQMDWLNFNFEKRTKKEKL